MRGFTQYILPAIIAGLFLLISVWLVFYLNNNENKLASKEKTETKSPDGTTNKREIEIYK
jgi:preprotein translocase subunit SecG